MAAENVEPSKSGERVVGLTFADPYDRVALERLDGYFLTFLNRGGNIEFGDATRLIAIGSDAMMGAIARARSRQLRPYPRRRHEAIASADSPMQWMMKEICGPFLQRHCDPLTNAGTIVFTYAGQDQPLDRIDFHCPRARPRQNSVQEKLTRRWIEFASSGSIPKIGGAGANG